MSVRLASVGFEVTIGSRTRERAVEASDELKERWADRDLPLYGGDNALAASSPIVLIATPWDAAGVTALSVADHLSGKVVICMANALVKVGDEFQPLVPPRGSVAAHVQAIVPRALVAAMRARPSAFLSMETVVLENEEIQNLQSYASSCGPERREMPCAVSAIGAVVSAVPLMAR